MPEPMNVSAAHAQEKQLRHSTKLCALRRNLDEAARERICLAMESAHESAEQMIAHRFDKDYLPPTVYDLSQLPDSERAVTREDILELLRHATAGGVLTPENAHQLLDRIQPVVQ